MGSSLRFLLLTSDHHLANILQERSEPFDGDVRFLAVFHGEKIAAEVKDQVFDGVIVDDSLVDPLAVSLMSRIRQLVALPSGGHPPFILITRECDGATLLKQVQQGFLDVFTKPLDLALFFQKLQIHFPQVHFLKENLLFNMRVDAPLQLGLHVRMVNAAEYGLTIRLNREVFVGETYGLMGKLFGAGHPDCLGRVISCIRREGQGEHYEASLVLIAPSKATLSALRLWIKHEYIVRKSNGIS